MIRFNANLYRIAMLCSSNEETRYYLQGAFVEPHAVKGVTLTATDGHKAITIYDESGFADEKAIIKLTPAALKACKPGRGERRDVVIAGADAVVNVTTVEMVEDVETVTDEPVAFSKDCKVDGTYPDYRRIYPSAIEFNVGSSSPAFGTLVMSTLNTVAVELAKHYGNTGVLRVNASSTNSPALVTFPPAWGAIAVAMPMRALCEDKVPSWFRAAA